MKILLTVGICLLCAASSLAQGIFICEGPNCPVVLLGVMLDNNNFGASSPSGTLVGNLAVLTGGPPSPPAFSGTYQPVSGPDSSKFQIVSSQLLTNGVISQGSYNVIVCAQQSTAVNSSVCGTFVITAQPAPVITFNPASPTIPSNATIGTTVATVQVTMSDNSQFNGTIGFGPPYGNDNSTFALNGNNIVTNASVAGVANTTANVTVVATTSGDPTIGLLPADRSAWANWKMAGLQSVGGIPNRSVVCSTVTPTGTDPTDVNAIQAAVNSCPAGQVVALAAGTFLIQEGNQVILNKGVTVRGAGPCAAVMTMPAGGYSNTTQATGCTLLARTNGAYIGHQGGGSLSPHFVMGVDIFDNSFSSTTSLASNAVQGSNTIQVTSTAGISVGLQVLLAEHGNFGWQSDWAYGGQVWAAPDWRITSSSHYPAQQADQYHATPPAAPSIPCYVSYANGTYCDLYVSEIKQVASIGPGPCPGVNCTVTFDSPVMITYRSAAPYNGLLAVFTRPWVTYAGVESMTLQNADYGDIVMTLCAYCWVKNVEDTVSAQGTMEITQAFRSQFEGLYDHKAAYPYIGGGGYFWSIFTASSELLFENSITMLADKVDVMEAAGGGNVFAYNYFDDGFCADYGCGDAAGVGFVSIESGANASHWMGTHHTLFEGNWMFNGSGDGSWGTNPFNTWFRNYAPGFRSSFTDYINNVTVDDIHNIPGGNAPLRGLSLSNNYYWNSYIGNVVGVSGHNYSGFDYVTYQDNPAIFYLGTSAGNSGGNNGDPEEVCDLTAASPTCPGYTGGTVAAASACVDVSGTDKCPEIRNINYDYLNNAVEYDPNNANHTLPNSFFLTSAPAYFGAGSTYAWPWTTPQNGATPLQHGPTTTNCTNNQSANWGASGPCSGLPAKARVDNGTPFTQP